MDRKQRIDQLVEDKSAIFSDVSDKVWEFAELGFKETRSSAYQIAVMEKEGFTIDNKVAGMDTAFTASYGSGHPVIAILGEFDALAGLSQKADTLCHSPIEEGQSGHGCGHNLLGAGAMAAATAVKDYMKENNLKGTVRYYGCPAEEGGSGKVFMVRAGLFKDADIALAWHPAQMNHVWDGKDCLGIYNTIYSFKGVTSHASASPHMGRSALDAAELMNVGVNFLREHVIPEARIHYAFLDAGGVAANVVQSTAKLSYIVRAPKMPDVYEITQRVNKIAEGAAMMTETSVSYKVVSGTANLLATKAVYDRYEANLLAALPVPFTKEELEYAQTYKDSLNSETTERQVAAAVQKYYPEKTAEERRAMQDMPMANFICRDDGNSASTDAGDVTWVVPGAQLHVACVPAGVPFHSWQMTSMGRSPLAKRGMLTAARVIAMTALDFILDEKLVEQAKKDHLDVLAGEVYRAPFSDDIQPGVQY